MNKTIKQIFTFIRETLDIKSPKILFLSYVQEIDYQDFTSTKDLYTELVSSKFGKADFYEYVDISLINGDYYIGENLITDYDFIFFGFISSNTQLFKPLLEYVKDKKIQYLQYGNTHDVDHKLYEFGLITKLGYSYIPTIMCTKPNKMILEQIEKNIGFPCVIKPINGSNGSGVRKVEDVSILKKRLKAAYVPMLVQKFIKSECDYRIILLKNKVVLVSRRTAEEGEFRNNASLGGTIDKSDIPTSVKTVLEDISKHLPYDMVGADVIFDENGQYYILEMNSAPSYFKFSKSCEVDIPDMIVNHIFKKKKELV